MNIIVVSSRLPKAITLGKRELVMLAATLGVAVMLFAWAASWATLQAARHFGWHLPSGLPMVSAAKQQQQIDALAAKLGEVQAKLLRLDGLSTQVAGQVGIDPKPFQAQQPIPQGGLLRNAHSLSAEELAQTIADTGSALDSRLDSMSFAQSMVRDLRLTQWHTPSNEPMHQGVKSSSFGWRIDPITGQQNFHEGLDFQGDIGTPIQAAAAGRVIAAEYHPQYGNMIDLDHGNGVTSRYAHASRLMVKLGQTVRAGETIAQLGNTGRSTGPHLHFEIRYKGVAQNPLQFLRLSQAQG